MSQDTIDAFEQDYAKNKTLLQRYTMPDEIACYIVFVASPMSRFMTGATIDVNGCRDLR
jgi:NAD(P)-dependent dehydrogenase (short-subunit alcohol dehydrogenase family)